MKNHKFVKSKSSPQSGEVWLADSLSFDDSSGSKSRPVMIRRREGDSFICYKCTTKPKDYRNRYRILDLEEAGLEKDTYLDHEPIKVGRNQLLYRMGTISQDDL